MKSTKRIKKETYYSRSVETPSPLYDANQTILKEIDSISHTTYSAFDILSTNVRSTSLEQKVYIILDNVDVISIDFDTYESGNQNITSTKKEDVMLADSSTVSVVTNYSQQDVTNHKVSYTIPLEVIDKMRQANFIKFRYYLDANIITLQPKARDLNLIKELIDTK